MTTTIKARVYQVTPEPESLHREWNIHISHPTRPRTQILGWAPSWPEAMQKAYKMLADLDAELMDEVHASRASRRETRNDIHTMEATA